VDHFLSAVESSLPFKIPATPMMSWDHLKKALEEYDIELGSHTVSHITLSHIKSKKKLFDEINNSKKYIEEQTGIEINILAFPNGNYSDEVLKQSKKAGYKNVLTVDEEMPGKNDFEQFKLPRLLIPYESYHQNLLKAENFHNVIKNFIQR
jgi:peptidoglycan/xylan/chitin deacetylase (PgdA/CDA1 family)